MLASPFHSGGGAGQGQGQGVGQGLAPSKWDRRRRSVIHHQNTFEEEGSSSFLVAGGGGDHNQTPSKCYAPRPKIGGRQRSAPTSRPMSMMPLFGLGGGDERYPPLPLLNGSRDWAGPGADSGVDMEELDARLESGRGLGGGGSGAADFGETKRRIRKWAEEASGAMMIFPAGSRSRQNSGEEEIGDMEVEAEEEEEQERTEVDSDSDEEYERLKMELEDSSGSLDRIVIQTSMDEQDPLMLGHGRRRIDSDIEMDLESPTFPSDGDESPTPSPLQAVPVKSLGFGMTPSSVRKPIPRSPLRNMHASYEHGGLVREMELDDGMGKDGFDLDELELSVGLDADGVGEGQDVDDVMEGAEGSASRHAKWSSLKKVTLMEAQPTKAARRSLPSNPTYLMSGPTSIEQFAPSKGKAKGPVTPTGNLLLKEMITNGSPIRAGRLSEGDRPAMLLGRNDSDSTNDSSPDLSMTSIGFPLPTSASVMRPDMARRTTAPAGVSPTEDITFLPIVHKGDRRKSLASNRPSLEQSPARGPRPSVVTPVHIFDDEKPSPAAFMSTGLIKKGTGSLRRGRSQTHSAPQASVAKKARPMSMFIDTRRMPDTPIKNNTGTSVNNLLDLEKTRPHSLRIVTQPEPPLAPVLVDTSPESVPLAKRTFERTDTTDSVMTAIPGDSTKLPFGQRRGLRRKGSSMFARTNSGNWSNGSAPRQSGMFLEEDEPSTPTRPFEMAGK